MRLSSVALGALLSATSLCSAQSAASIHVTVLDADEKPVTSAVVQADVDADEDGKLWDMAPMCSTGEDGSCALDVWRPGQWVVSVSKYQDGYPGPDQFYLGRNFKQTIIKTTEKSASENVVVHIGPKQGFLTLIVTDAVTGKEITSARFKFHWVSDPTNSTESGNDPDIATLAPANVPVTMVATSQGYEDWTYTSSTDPADHVLLLQSGERRTLYIRLQPKP